MNTIIVTKESAVSSFNELKRDIELMSQQIKDMEISDNARMQVAISLSTSLDKVLKKIDQRRKELKKPYMESIRMIDSVAKQISEPGKSAMESIRQKMVEYQNKQHALKLAEEERIRRELEKKEREINSEMYAAETISEKIREYESKVMEMITSCNSIDELKTVANTYYRGSEMENMRKAVRSLATSESLISFAEDQINRSIDRIKQVGLQKQKDLQQADFSDQKDIVIPAEDGTALQNLKTQLRQKLDEAEMKAVSAEMQISTFPTVPVRKSYMFELVDKNEAPAEWLMLNEPAIREWIARNKENGLPNPQDGEIVNGVMFRIRTTPILR